MAHNLELGKTITLNHGKWIANDNGTKFLHFTLDGAVINGKEYKVLNAHLYQPTRDRDGASVAPYIGSYYSDLTDAAKKVIRDYLLANGPSVQEQILTEEEITRRVQRHKDYLENQLQRELKEYEKDLRASAKLEVY